MLGGDHFDEQVALVEKLHAKHLQIGVIVILGIKIADAVVFHRFHVEIGENALFETGERCFGEREHR